jgi:hypothetical protein
VSKASGVIVAVLSILEKNFAFYEF